MPMPTARASRVLLVTALTLSVVLASCSNGDDENARRESPGVESTTTSTMATGGVDAMEAVSGSWSCDTTEGKVRCRGLLAFGESAPVSLSWTCDRDLLGRSLTTTTSVRWKCGYDPYQRAEGPQEWSCLERLEAFSADCDVSVPDAFLEDGKIDVSEQWGWRPPDDLRPEPYLGRRVGLGFARAGGPGVMDRWLHVWICQPGRDGWNCGPDHQWFEEHTSAVSRTPAEERLPLQGHLGTGTWSCRAGQCQADRVWPPVVALNPIGVIVGDRPTT